MFRSPIDSTIITCEHATNRVPSSLRGLFADADAILQGHRGWDIGAKIVAQVLARTLGIPAHYGSASRLVVDLNRSLGHRQLFSEFTKQLSVTQKNALIRTLYQPYRDGVLSHLQSLLNNGTVFHLSVHSFTPQLAGNLRRADIGLLYDPGRRREKLLCRQWQGLLGEQLPGHVVRRNYPYRGIDDGFVPFLRQNLPVRRYIGVELEINQRLLSSPNKARRFANALCPILSLLLATASSRRNTQ